MLRIEHAPNEMTSLVITVLELEEADAQEERRCLRKFQDVLQVLLEVRIPWVVIPRGSQALKKRLENELTRCSATKIGVLGKASA